MLPTKVKCETELENEGLFNVKQKPVDKDSHVLIERESVRRKDTEEEIEISDSSSDDEKSIEVDLDGKPD